MISYRIRMSVLAKEAAESIKRAPEKTNRGIRRAFYFIGKDLVSDAKSLVMRGPRSGKIYLFRGKRIRASAPGEPPQRVTGKLRKYIDFKVRGADQLEFGVLSEVNYAGYLEKGTGKMKARQFLAPTVKKNEKNVRNHFEKHIKASLEE